jgi:hypothetical protein
MGHILKRTATVLVLCCVLIFSAPQKSHALMPCMMPGLGSGFSIGTVWQVVSSIAIQAAQSALQSLLNSLISSVTDAMSEMFDIFGANAETWFDQFWYYDLYPALASQTAQLHTSTEDTSRGLASLQDASELARTTRMFEELEADAYREHEPSELQCEAASITGGLQRMTSIKRAYARAAPIRRARRAEASADDGSGDPTPPAEGLDVYQLALKEDHCNRYVNVQANAGNTICGTGAADGVWVDEDINAANLFVDNYNVRDADLQQNLDDFIDNLVGLTPVGLMTPEMIDTVPGKAAFLDNLSFMSRQQLAHAALYRVVANIVPGSNMGHLVAVHRGRAGYSADGGPVCDPYTPGAPGFPGTPAVPPGGHGCGTPPVGSPFSGVPCIPGNPGVPGCQCDGSVAIPPQAAGSDCYDSNPSWNEIERAILESASVDLQSRMASVSPENIDSFLATLAVYQLTFGMAEVSDFMDYALAMQAVKGAMMLEPSSGDLVELMPEGN